MMGHQKQERELFNYAVNLERRVRSDHPLRRVAAAIDFRFVRAEVAGCYGSNGQVSVDPEVIMKTGRSARDRTGQRTQARAGPTHAKAALAKQSQVSLCATGTSSRHVFLLSPRLIFHCR